MVSLVLASESPRRKDILSMFECPFEIIPSTIEEVVDEKEDPAVVVMALALQKALDVAGRAGNSALVLGADTIVYKDRILGKPRDEADAYEMLHSIQGGDHFVYTGFALIHTETQEKVVDVVKTRVRIRPMDDDAIYAYIRSGEVWGKAGAYAIQGKGSLIVDQIEGDYFNVVGLPIGKVAELMKERFGFQLMK